MKYQRISRNANFYFHYARFDISLNRHIKKVEILLTITERLDKMRHFRFGVQLLRLIVSQLFFSASIGLYLDFYDCAYKI